MSASVVHLEETDFPLSRSSCCFVIVAVVAVFDWDLGEAGQARKSEADLHP